MHGLACVSKHHPPGLACRPLAPGPDLAAEFDKMGGRAEFAQSVADLIDGIAGSDAAQFEPEAPGRFSQRRRGRTRLDLVHSPHESRTGRDVEGTVRVVVHPAGDLHERD
jgi:hypothetical protein